MANEQSATGNGSGGDNEHPLKLAVDLVDLATIYGRLARVMRRLASRSPIDDGAGAAELDWLLTEAHGLDERARTVWETKLEPALIENAKRFKDGRPPWPE